MLDILVQAYGPEGLGILTVAGVPSFLELRREVLPLTAEFVVRMLACCKALATTTTSCMDCPRNCTSNAPCDVRILNTSHVGL